MMMDYINVYYKNKLMRPQREKSPNTVATYLNALKALDEWLVRNCCVSLRDDTIQKIKGYMLEQYDQFLSGQKFSISTHNLRITVTKNFFTYLCDAGYLDKNPSELLDLIYLPEDEEKAEKEARGFTVEQVSEMMKEADGCNRLRDRALIALIVGSSMRISEACSLNMENIAQLHTEKHTFVKIKGGRKVRMEVAEWAIPYIDEYINAERGKAGLNAPLFVTRYGGKDNRLTRTTAYASIANIQHRLGINTGLHSLRHTAVTEIKRATGDIAAAQAVAHHRSSFTTQRYDHTIDSVQDYLDNNALAEVFRETNC